MPSGITPRVRASARRLTAGAPTPYRRMTALVRHLKATYPYRLDVPQAPPEAEWVDHFMFVQRQGFCEQFATSLAVMGRLSQVHESLGARLGTSVRLMPTTAATTLRKDRDPPVVIDGPFAETKEQLLGFYILDVPDLEAALDACRALARANPGGAYEVRPISLYQPREVDSPQTAERRYADKAPAS